jgi:hypothetical protein
MTQLSSILAIIAAIAVAIAVRAFQHRVVAGGFDSLAVAAIAIAWLTAFTLPVRCKVSTVQRRGCANQAYGFLFGCSNAAGHKFGKFFRLLGWQKEADRTVSAASQRRGSVRYASGPASPIVVNVEGGGKDACGFWFGLISTVAAIASVGLAIVPLLSH